jgi:hypothetical protein
MTGRTTRQMDGKDDRKDRHLKYIIYKYTFTLILSINAGDLLHIETTGFSLGQISLPNFTKVEYQIHTKIH